MNIFRKLLLLVFTALGLALAGCGGGGGGGTATPATTKVTVSGSVVKGPVTGATVTFFALNTDGSKGAQLGTATTDTNGNYTIALSPAPTTPFLAETARGSYVDEVTGVTITLAATDKLQAALPVGTTLATVTPLTHIAAARAQALAASGTPLATAINTSNTGVAAQYGIADIIATLPPAANNANSVASTTREERIYALVLAGIAQQASGAGVRAIDLAKALADDARDGILDGKNGAVAINVPTINGGSLPLPITAGTINVQTAINAFIASVNNKTNLTQLAIPLTPIQLGTNTAGSLYPNFPVLPAVLSGQAYIATLTATGGTPPYTCILKTGSLPSGYSLIPSTCQITSTTVATTPVATTSISAPFTVTLTDSAIPPVSVDIVELRVTTIPPKPTFTPVAGVMTVGVQGSTPVVSVPTGGSPPYYFAHDSFAYGAHPLGTTIDLNGNLTGTPSQTGVFNFKVCVIDLVGAKNCQMTSVTVNPAAAGGTPSIAITSATCINSTVTVMGTVTGPVGVQLRDNGNINDIFLGLTCPSWPFICRRDANEPAVSNWTGSALVNVPGGSTLSFGVRAGTTTASGTVTCPNQLATAPVLTPTPAPAPTTFCACQFDVNSRAFGFGGAWICHNTTSSNNPGFLTDVGVCECRADLFQVCPVPAPTLLAPAPTPIAPDNTQVCGAACVINEPTPRLPRVM